MAIKSTTFGRTELSGEDATWFIRQMNENKPKDQPNEKIKSALEKGRKVLASINARR
jgi:hypothetical protein